MNAADVLARIADLNLRRSVGSFYPEKFFIKIPSYRQLAPIIIIIIYIPMQLLCSFDSFNGVRHLGIFISNDGPFFTYKMATHH